jgi:putative flippase GtrA
MNLKDFKKPITLCGKGISYVVVAGISWVLGLFIFYVGIRLRISPFFANIIGDLVGVTFVFFVSSEKTFSHNGKNIGIKFLIYLIYMMIMIGLVSFVIMKIYEWEILITTCRNRFIEPGIAAKILITPITLTCNFYVTLLLVEGRFFIVTKNE